MNNQTDSQTEGLREQGELEIQSRYRLIEALSSSERKSRQRVEKLQEVVFETDAQGRLLFLNKAWETLLGHPLEASLGQPLTAFVWEEDRAQLAHCFTCENFDHCLEGNSCTEREGTAHPLSPDNAGDCMHPGPLNDGEIRFTHADGSPVWVSLSSIRIDKNLRLGILHDLMERKQAESAIQRANDKLEVRIGERTAELRAANAQLLQQMQERQRMEQELQLAHKLEAVGQLAAGIAHEINTPMQFIGDNVHFLREAFDDLLGLIEHYATLKDTVRKGGDGLALLAAIEAAEASADLDYLREHAPRAIERTLDGISRVCSIVSAMKVFSHPHNDKAPIDINAAIQTTLTVVRNEYKYVAEVDTEFGDLPLVPCHGGDMNQVFLNLIVNAAHAIEAVQESGDDLGHIRIRTSYEDGLVVIAVSDTGCGIPEAIRHRIFDPFFTTKEVGRGTGQGLSMVRTIVVDKHGGSLNFDTEIGRGTTFFVRIPIDDKALSTAVAS
ncbi:hypothetical protein MNBD_GAMMA20-1533 [hydrothermal vent metagenome]|uniref:Histidine kinase n=1 Tax=hydrothermal vent metagenome TaxID=652676 RepID=A0A3B1ALU0_9ZZZZ